VRFPPIPIDCYLGRHPLRGRGWPDQIKSGHDNFELRKGRGAFPSAPIADFPGKPRAKAGIQAFQLVVDPGSPLRYSWDDELGRRGPFSAPC
jgi:hypothetical protein